MIPASSGCNRAATKRTSTNLPSGNRLLRSFSGVYRIADENDKSNEIKR